MFNEDDILALFISRIDNPNINYSDMTEDGFKIFKSFFILVNSAQGNLKAKPKPYRSATYPYNYQYNNNYMDQNEFEYSVHCSPLELQGMATLRRLLFELSDKGIAVKAIDFHNQLFDNIEARVDVDLKVIRSDFLNECLIRLRGSDELATKNRSLLLLKKFMEECEKNGTGGLKSHSSMLKGTVHTITIINNYSYTIQNTKIPKRFVFKLYNNTTFWDLRCLISNKAQLLPN